MDYSFRSSLNALAAPGFRNHVLENFMEGFSFTTTVAIYLPTLFRVTNKLLSWLPEHLTEKYFAYAHGLEAMQALIRERVDDAVRRADADGGKRPSDEEGGFTMFDAMARPIAAKNQVRPSKRDMVAEGCLMVVAGTGTSARTLQIVLWYVTQNVDIQNKLVAELKRGMGKDEMVSSARLEGEGFEYLRAVVKEGLRLSFGVPGVMARKAPKQGVTMCGRFIPGGVSANLLILPSTKWKNAKGLRFRQLSVLAFICRIWIQLLSLLQPSSTPNAGYATPKLLKPAISRC